MLERLQIELIEANGLEGIPDLNCERFKRLQSVYRMHKDAENSRLISGKCFNLAISFINSSKCKVEWK